MLCSRTFRTFQPKRVPVYIIQLCTPSSISYDMYRHAKDYSHHFWGNLYDMQRIQFVQYVAN